jgi:hypothetical protein
MKPTSEAQQVDEIAKLDEYLLQHARQNAVVEAQKFIDDQKDALGIFTLRKAFELGYIRGFLYDGE